MRIVAILFIVFGLSFLLQEVNGQRWLQEKYEVLEKLSDLHDICLEMPLTLDSVHIGRAAEGFFNQYKYGKAPPYLAFNAWEKLRKEEPWVDKFMSSPYTPKLPLQMKEKEPWAQFFQWIKQYEIERYVLVNIPSATLYVFESGNVVFESKVIVGTTQNQTPVLATNASHITIYPYWTPTQNILFNEIIPSQIKDSTYLERSLFEVVSRKGRIMKPSQIDWKDVKWGSFPYTVRQSTGCDNSLGLLKIHIDNPYSIYLHDTPHTHRNISLFSRDKRFFSHGCIRLEKPLELANLLGPLEVIDQDLMNKCLVNQQPKDIKLKKDIPVFVMYFTKYLNNEDSWVEVEDYYRLGEN